MLLGGVEGVAGLRERGWRDADGRLLRADGHGRGQREDSQFQADAARATKMDSHEAPFSCCACADYSAAPAPGRAPGDSMPAAMSCSPRRLTCVSSAVSDSRAAPSRCRHTRGWRSQRGLTQPG